MKYLFILGRNPELSCAEIFSYLKKENIIIRSQIQKNNNLLIEADNINTERAIKCLGGTIAIGKVFFTDNFDNITKEIEKNEIYFDKEIKFTYSLMNFCSEQEDEILEIIKQKFKNEKLKAQYRHIRGEIKTQDNELVFGTPSRLISKDKIYFLFKDKNYNFGVIEQVYDTRETEKRDMNKPVRREALAISPRISKILINLSQVRENETLVDPFSGIGVILQEALLQNINVFGIELSSQACKDAEKNILWLKNKYNFHANYKIINSDSRNFKLSGFDAIATEPELGELISQLPTEKQAGVIFNKFENLVIDVLNNLKKNLKGNGKIVFTTPYIKIQENKRIACDIKKICNKTNLKICEINKIKLLIKEYRKDQIVGREICVLEKI